MHQGGSAQVFYDSLEEAHNGGATQLSSFYSKDHVLQFRDLELRRWIRIDEHATTHLRNIPGGPPWKNVRFRSTIDLTSGKYLEQMQSVSEITEGLFQPTTLLTELWYEGEELGSDGGDQEEITLEVDLAYPIIDNKGKVILERDTTNDATCLPNGLVPKAQRGQKFRNVFHKVAIAIAMKRKLPDLTDEEWNLLLLKRKKIDMERPKGGPPPIPAPVSYTHLTLPTIYSV